MRKLILSLLILTLFSSAQAFVKIQGQVASLGYGYGIGIDMPVIPLIMKLGLEGMIYSSPKLSAKGTYKNESTGVKSSYDGSFTADSTRFGAYLNFNVPVLSSLPFVGFLFRPVIHAGTQRINLNVDGSVYFGDNLPVDQSIVAEGAYALIGFPFNLGPVFIEPAIGVQHIFAEHYGNFPNTPEAQLAIGVAF